MDFFFGRFFISKKREKKGVIEEEITSPLHLLKVNEQERVIFLVIEKESFAGICCEIEQGFL